MRGGVRPLFGLLLVAGMAYSGGATVRLAIRHNGKMVALPKEITLSFAGTSRRLAVRSGAFEAPEDAVRSPDVTFYAMVQGGQIRIEGINGVKLADENWTIVLEDHRFSSDFEPLSKGAVARLACAIIFQPNAHEGTVEFVPHCRSKIPNGRAKGAPGE